MHLEYKVSVFKVLIPLLHTATNTIAGAYVGAAVESEANIQVLLILNTYS